MIVGVAVVIIVVVCEVVAIQANAASWARSGTLLRLLLLSSIVNSRSATHSTTGLANPQSVGDVAGDLLVSVARLRTSARL